MKRNLAALVVLAAGLLFAAPARASSAVQISESPNPVLVGQRVVHTVTITIPGRLDVWVSAQGFAQPGKGTLPAGTWTQTCCPAQTAGTSAWHYRSTGTVAPGTYRFGADARRAGTYLSTAAVSSSSAGVWVRVV